MFFHPTSCPSFVHWGRLEVHVSPLPSRWPKTLNSSAVWTLHRQCWKESVNFYFNKLTNQFLAYIKSPLLRETVCECVSWDRCLICAQNTDEKLSLCFFCAKSEGKTVTQIGSHKNTLKHLLKSKYLYRVEFSNRLSWFDDKNRRRHFLVQKSKISISWESKQPKIDNFVLTLEHLL